MKPAAVALLFAAAATLLAQQSDWDALDKQIEQLYLKGDLAGALRVAKLAVDAATTPKQSGHSLDRLGFLYYNSGNLKDGEAFLRKSLALRKEKLGADSADYAESANDLALFLRDTRRFPEGQSLAEEAVAVRSRVLGPSDPLVAETLETLGSILSGEGQYDKSAATFEKARAIYESHIDAQNPAPPEYGTLLVNLAGNYHRLGKYQRAETDFNTALDVLRKTIGPTHPIYATSLMGPGNLEMELGNYSAAEKFYNEAEPLLKSSLGQTHPIYVQLLDHRAVLYQAMEIAPRRNPITARLSSCARKSTGRITCWWPRRCVITAAWCTCATPKKAKSCCAKLSKYSATLRIGRHSNMPTRCWRWAKPSENAAIFQTRGEPFSRLATLQRRAWE